MGEVGIARPRQFTDDEILDVAQGCILEHGPSVSTTMIAERLGISQAALFKRFGTKENLIVAALSRPMGKNPVADVLAEGPTDDPIPDQLVALGVGIMTMMRRLVPCMAMLHAAAIDTKAHLGQDHAPPKQARKLITAWFQRGMDQGRIRPMDPHIMAVGFIGMLKARPFREIILGDDGLKCSDEVYVRQLVEQMWSGISGEEA